MCVGIEKIAEMDEVVQYVFVSDVREPNPKLRRRIMVIGQNQGVMQVTKATGEVTLIEVMPEDEGNVRFTRAAMKVRRHWEKGEFPNKTMFASG